MPCGALAHLQVKVKDCSHRKHLLHFRDHFGTPFHDLLLHRCSVWDMEGICIAAVIRDELKKLAELEVIDLGEWLVARNHPISKE